MDKKDVMYMIGALCITLIIALVIKPVMTGHPVNTGINLSTPTPTPIPVTLINTTIYQAVITNVTTIPTPIPTPVPKPVPTCDKSVKGVAFVDPSVYGIATNQSYPNSSRFDQKLPDTNMTPYAKFSGQYSGTTQTINIPFPYWALVYTVEPFPVVVYPQRSR
jgi:hypothetical protein